MHPHFAKSTQLKKILKDNSERSFAKQWLNLFQPLNSQDLIVNSPL